MVDLAFLAGVTGPAIAAWQMVKHVFGCLGSAGFVDDVLC
jgi:hypothetical protein